MKTINTFSKTFLAFVLLFSPSFIKAQMVGPNSYIKGTNLEIGVCGVGGFEGVPTATSPTLAGMHPRSSTGFFGFVANPQLDGWATFDGDFFTPGSPENGWGFEIGTTGGVFAGNNCSYLQQINGGISSYSHTFNCYNVDWGGDMTSGTDLHFHINYFLQETDLFYTTTVSITNNTAATIPELYYYRNVDPDNNEEFGGEFPTTNTVVSEPGSSVCDLAHVKATSTLPASQPMSYLGFAGIGNNFRVGHGGFSNRDGSDMWNGVGFVETVGTATYADEAEYLSYKISNLAPGATETFKFVVILDDAAATAAINNLLYFSYPGSLFSPPPVCTPYIDTVNTCGAPVGIGVSGSVVTDFTWSWSPGTGLSSTTGPSVTASPGTTTTYTVTGTPISTCVAPTSMQIVVNVTPADGNNPYITPVPVQCVTSPAFNLTVDSAGGTWTGPGITNTTLGTFDPAIAGTGTHLIGYITPGYCNTTDSVLITVISNSSATIVQPPIQCTGGPAINLTAGSIGGVWTGPGITSASLGTFDPGVAGAGSDTITYTINTGVCISQDTVVITVLTSADATITQPAPLCIGSPALNLTAVTPGGTWSGTGITNPALGTFNPPTAGVGPHTITYTVSGTCGDVDTVIVTVFAVVNSTITPVSPICVNASPITLTDATAGGTWSGTGITNPVAGTFSPTVAGAGVHTITYTVSGLCGSTSTTNITVVAMPVISFVADTTQGCEPTTITFTPTVNQPGGTYHWDFGMFGTSDTSIAAIPSYTYIYAGTYDVVFNYTNTTGCKTTDSQTGYITIHPQPGAAFSMNPQPADMLNPVITFNDQSLGGVVSWDWNFGNGITSTLQHPIITYPDTGSYVATLIVSNMYTCKDTANEVVRIDPLFMFYAPNAFTPNGNGNNDVFMVYGEGIKSDAFEMRIYDRWGELLFRTNDPYKGWNGAKNNTGDIVKEDVYVYKVNLRDFRGNRHEYIGSVSVIK